MNHWRLCCVFVLLQLSPLMASSGSRVRNLPGFSGDLPFHLETGYIGLGEAEELQVFYLFVESQRNPATDPLLFWLVGDPGCAGLSSFFFQNGPLIFDRNYNGRFPKLELNPYAWTQVLNVIFVDLPVGTGFSYSETQEGYYSSDTIWIDQAYGFLQKWLIENPDFRSNSLYIGGSSYCGMSVPSLVQKVYEDNQASSRPLMNIKGYMLGSPYANIRLDLNARIEYAYRLGLLSDELYQSMRVNCNGDYVNINPNNMKCVSDFQIYSDLVRYINIQQILEPDCVTAPHENQRILFQHSQTTLRSIQNPYSFWCRGNDSILIDIWANDEKVQDALHVRQGTKGQFERCNFSLAYTKELSNVIEVHRNLTYTNLESLIYSGNLDMAVPYISTQQWIRSLNLTVAYPWRAWFVEGQVAGYVELRQRNDYDITYVSIKGAGHATETYLPKQTFNLIKRWFSYSVI